MNITIDTNVFIHLFNPAENPDSHIDHLLIHLAKFDPHLCVDSTKKISNEYLEKLGPMVSRSEDTGIQLQLLRFWMNSAPKENIAADPTDLLMHRIRQAIPEEHERADRMFVYVSRKAACFLVTNDDIHILSRRSTIKSKTKKLCDSYEPIMNSREAVAHFASHTAPRT